jgi:hypothetical protein
LNVANWEFFSVVDLNFADGLQKHISIGSLPRLSFIKDVKDFEENKEFIVALDSKENKILKKKDELTHDSFKKQQKSRKKLKKKPRTYSINEQETIPIAPNRPRAGTETFPDSPKSQIIKPLGSLPSANRLKPWGSRLEKVTTFNEIQSQEKQKPFSISRWESSSKVSLSNFQEIQEVEKEDKDLEDALIQIALMESKSS